MATGKSQLPHRVKGQATCKHHQEKQLDFYCEQCDEPVCQKCFTSIHKSHPICDLSEITIKKTEDIKNFIDKTERYDLVETGKCISSIDCLFKDNDSAFEKLREDLDLTSNQICLYKKVKENNIKLIQNYKQDLETYEEHLNKNMDKCKTALQRGTHIDIYDVSSEIISSSILPVKSVLDTLSSITNIIYQSYVNLDIEKSASFSLKPTSADQDVLYASDCQEQASSEQLRSDNEKTNTFIPNQNDQSRLNSIVRQTTASAHELIPIGQDGTNTSAGHTSTFQRSEGQCQKAETFISDQNGQSRPKPFGGSTITSGPGTKLGDQDRSHTSAGQAQAAIPQQMSEAKEKTTETSYKLLSETKSIGEWSSSCGVVAVCPTSDGKVWTRNYTNRLALLDRNDKVIKKTTHKADIRDMSLSPSTQRPWICDKDNNVMEMISGPFDLFTRLGLRFKTKDRAECIVPSAGNYVIIGMARNIAKFTIKRQVLQKSTDIKGEKPLICSPRKITEFPVTQNVAVVDYNIKRDVGDNKKRVVAMDKDFRELFVYNGSVPGELTVKRGRKTFIPQGLVYDRQGNLIIGDKYATAILLLNGGGDFLRIIHLDTDWLWDIGLDKQDVLWS
ncbi:tripartite motif-containing protein 2-like [Argopecten irradians]|uniref:tripartite motif-containing protein 2-like n=1 Tax=Argopecten irradians TaxID=31199 RepID=UPI0037155915